MTMHRLSAGAGYQYLLKHTASGDCDRSAVTPLVAYYAESGNPPGRWLGRGLAGLGDGAGVAKAGDAVVVGLSVGSMVTEPAMANLYGSGRDPLSGVPLGRVYPPVVPVAQRIAAKTADLPTGMTPEARRAAVDVITRIELGRPVARAVAGFDLTFTPPKSASTLWALGDTGTQQRVLDAHRVAVEGALGFLEERALFTRMGHGGCRQARCVGMIVAAFDHWDSRAGDPNLHTHAVVANKVQGKDSVWRSVDSRALHHAIVAVSELYDDLFADELVRALPVRWGWRHRGARRSPGFELDGVDDVLLGEFSTRTTQIDEAMTRVVARFYATHGRGPNRIEVTRLRQQVTRATRPDKHVHPLRDLFQAWRRRAWERTGHTPEELTAAMLRAEGTPPVTAAGVPADAVGHLAGVVLEQVMVRRSTWTVWNVFAEAARATRGVGMATSGDRLDLLDRVTGEVLRRCVSVEAPALFTASGAYARADGSSVFDRVGEEKYTHPAVLAAEARLLAAADDDAAPAIAVPVLTAVVDPASGATTHLAADQVDALTAVASSGRRVDVLVGPAGSGKTTTLAGLRQTWEHTWGRGSVLGLAPSSTAAGELAHALAVPCENTAKWIHESTGPGAERRTALLGRLGELRAGATGLAARTRLRTIDTATAGLRREQERWRLHPGQLVILDEASLAGTATLDGIVTQATTAGAKVLLVGDHAQLGAVDAGGAFALLAERSAPARLTSLWRFAHPWEAAATIRLRTGDVGVIDTYLDHDRVSAGAGEAMLEDAYTAWAADTDTGVPSILIAPDSRTVTALNTRAHNDRVVDALVTPGGVTTGGGVVIGVGDRIVTRTNDRRLRLRAEDGGGYVRNGDLWDVTAVFPDGSLAARRTDRRAPQAAGGTGSRPPGPAGLVVLPGGYVAEHVDLGYATTTHRAQGITVERAHVLAHPGMFRENLYVAMSRGRDTNHVYVSVDDIDPECDHLPDPHATPDGRDVLATILTTPGAELSATATIATRQDNAESLHRLSPIRRALLADAARNRWARALTDAGLPGGDLHTVLHHPEAGRLFTTLERIGALTPDTRQVLTGLVGDLPDRSSRGDVGGDLTGVLQQRAMTWLRTQVQDPYDVHPAPSAVGIDEDGVAVLTQVDRLITQRINALTDETLEARPDWTRRLGPEPTDPVAHAAWLDELAAIAAHLDETSHPATPRPARPVSPEVPAGTADRRWSP